MAKKNRKKSEFDNLLDGTAQKSLQKMVDDMLKLATNVAKEYNGLDASELSELSGSVIEITENSPFLNEIFEGDSWKRVMDMGSLFGKQSGSLDDTK
jgi:hypothetical protein